jgi:cytochrome c
MSTHSFRFQNLLFLAIVAIAPAAHAADPDGKTLFEKRCAGCHGIDADHEGPRLRGVVGRRAGSVTTFDYSKPMQSAGFNWDAASLEKWLTDPDSVVPGTDMSFRVPKPEDRAAIIAYLSTQKP